MPRFYVFYLVFHLTRLSLRFRQWRNAFVRSRAYWRDIVFGRYDK